MKRLGKVVSIFWRCAARTRNLNRLWRKQGRRDYAIALILENQQTNMHNRRESEPDSWALSREGKEKER